MTDKIFLYVSPGQLKDSKFILSEEESHHLKHVLRLNKGQNIWLTDGEGCSYQGELTSVNGKAQGLIHKILPGQGESPWKIQLAMPVIKKSRMEWMIEKATELGVNDISLIWMERCRKQNLNFSRLSRIIQSAGKQSGRSKFPELIEYSSLSDFLSRNTNNIVAAHSEGKIFLNQYLEQSTDNKLTLLIGPEGDFSKNEIELMRQKDIPQINLGYRRLRSETAGIYVLSNVSDYCLNLTS